MKKNSLLTIALIMFMGAFAFTACSKKDDVTAEAANYSAGTQPSTVYMKNMKFSPYELKATAGTTVTWINSDTLVYSVTADDGSFESGDIQPGGSYSRSFTEGTIMYHSRHGLEMNGKITVTAKQ